VRGPTGHNLQTSRLRPEGPGRTSTVKLNMIQFQIVEL